MPERPLLKLPELNGVQLPRRRGGGMRLTKPTRERQGERLGPKFDLLAQAADDPAQIMRLQQDPQAMAPERAIVFEVAGSLTQFYQEANRIGLEFLGDDEFVFEPDEDFRRSDRPEKQIAGRIYLAMPNLEALINWSSCGDATNPANACAQAMACGPSSSGI